MDCHDRFPLLPEAIFPPPWSVEETNACFIVRDANGPGAGLRLFREAGTTCGARLLTRDEARRIPEIAARPPELVEATLGAHAD